MTLVQPVRDAHSFRKHAYDVVRLCWCLIIPSLCDSVRTVDGLVCLVYSRCGSFIYFYLCFIPPLI